MHVIQVEKSSKTGFTIVEILVVMVIISILVSITYVSYRGVQDRSRSSNASSQASMVQRKSEAWHSALGAYPTYTQLSTGKVNAGDTSITAPAEARIPSAADILIDASSSDPTNEQKVAYRACPTSGGAQVEWYDALSSNVKYIGIGGASSTTPCT